MWLTETPWPPIIALLVAAVVFGFLWSRTRRRPLAILALVCLVLVPAAYFVEQAVVTPAEEVEQHVRELRDSVVAGDVERTLSFFAASAEAERGAVQAGMKLVDVKDDLRITDLSVKTVGEDTQAVTHFRANGTVVPENYGDQHVATRWEISWRKEAGEWKLYKIVRLNPVTGDPMGLMSQE
jgi:hypothetical protein